MMTFASIWNLCSTAAPQPQDKEYYCFPRNILESLVRRHADEGRDVGTANYKARLNLRDTSTTGAKLGDLSRKGNKPTRYDTAPYDPDFLFDGGRSGRT